MIGFASLLENKSEKVPLWFSSICLGALRYLPLAHARRLRVFLLRLAGVKFDGPVEIRGTQLIGIPDRLRIGAGAFINAECVFEGDGGIVIGAGSLLGPE